MAFNSGFLRKEALARFGRDQEDLGQEVVVVMERHTIEIRSLDDETRVRWAVGCFKQTVRGARVRFECGMEWLESDDPDLVVFLKSHAEEHPESIQTRPGSSKAQKKRALLHNLLFFAVLCTLLLGGGIVLIDLMTKRALTQEIKMQMDEAILMQLPQVSFCNPELVDFSAFQTFSPFLLRKDLGFEAARLPTGRVLLDATRLENASEMAAWLEAAGVRNAQDDPALATARKLSWHDRVVFLSRGKVEARALIRAWGMAVREDAWPDLVPVEMYLTDAQWLALVTLCAPDR